MKQLLSLVLLTACTPAVSAIDQPAASLRENYLVSVRVLKSGAQTPCGEMSVITGSPQFRGESNPADGKGLWMDLVGSLRPTGSDKVFVDYVFRTTTTGQPPPFGETSPGAQSQMKLDLGEEYPVFRSGDLVYMLSVCIYRKARMK
ncbi:MAG: hypothetical protein K1X78_09350 [Verrucomicrobiaceae bacterium]|nr:hypothetical protein [Verrucomicrobiaceae bacterium]